MCGIVGGMVSQSVDRIEEDDDVAPDTDHATDLDASARPNRLAAISALLGLACVMLFAGLVVWFVALKRLPPPGWDTIGTALVAGGVLAALAGLVLSMIAKRRGQRRAFTRAGFWLCLLTLILVGGLFAQYWLSRPSAG